MYVSKCKFYCKGKFLHCIFLWQSNVHVLLLIRNAEKTEALRLVPAAK